ncbi:hypothetical protein IMX26_11500 [Clostridium sp. 'deep sea']|uniref:HEAT repeat domain-containing protein n=1 Tax=Clostridium sp. 'deep sea' TaxID=2779445 RepID=UPI0018964C04|nr:HEAT repeat domain-containing protein [Clostridium sp. 'deep sea']QOR34114.1 hypothetical protein IMX26_11500 [Clostridium sp. 'deep sea']
MRNKNVLILFIILLLSLLVACQQSTDDIIAKNINNLTKSNPYLRIKAITSLASTEDVRAILPIAKMLNDPDQGVINQAYIELNKLRNTGIAVDYKILKSLSSFNASEQKAITKYTIIAHQNGIDIQTVLLTVLPKVNQIDNYADLIIYVHSRANSNLYPLLLAELSTSNGGVAADVLLLLDKYGYTPSKALVDELINQGYKISEATGQLLVQFACRESYAKPNNPNNQYQVFYQNGNIIINDNSSSSLERCKQGDIMFNNLPHNITYLTRLAILYNQPDVPKEIKGLFNTFVNMDQEKLVSMVLKDNEILCNNEKLRESVITVFANNSTINSWINAELKPLDVTAVITPIAEVENGSESKPDSDSNDTEIKEQAVLIIGDDGLIIGEYHWYLPQKFRPLKKEDIRYVINIASDGTIYIADIIKKELVLYQELNDSSKIYKLIDEFILGIDLDD